jgi:hypothetical protein
MSQRAHGHASGKVEVLLALAIPDIRALATHRPDIVATVVREYILAEPLSFGMGHRSEERKG